MARKTNDLDKSSKNEIDSKKIHTKLETKKIPASVKTIIKTAEKNIKKLEKTSKKVSAQSSKAEKNKVKNTRTKSSTKRTAKTKPVSIIEHYELPYRYNETIVKILYQTPNTLFVYWDISDKDRKKYLIISVVSVLVIALITVSIIAVQLRHNKNEKKKNMEETTVHTMMVQETTVQETTEEETTEEDTTQEESAEVVDKEVVEDFFENEISTENEEAFELPPRQLTDEFIPYDGQKREITCYGDSMMAGAGSTTEGKVNGIDIYGWTTPVTIENMTNIPTHNLGGSGEDSSYITFRAGGTKVYIDRDITISETDSAIARIIDEDGNVQDAQFIGGCDGNTKGVCALIKGMKAKEVIARLKGITCGNKPTSCPDQLATALQEMGY